VTAVTVTPEAVYAGTPVGLFAGRRVPSSTTASAVPTEMERVESRGGAIRALAVTDTLLLVAGETGLEVFDRGAGAWSLQGAGEGRVGEVFALAVDPEANVWIGTARGLSRWRPNSGEWDEWALADGLAGAPVLHILAEDGVVWASTPAGVSRFAWREAGR
jgi:ligand-binding sensor domain-containing protein